MLSTDILPPRANTLYIANVYNDNIVDILNANPKLLIFINVRPLNDFLGKKLYAMSTPEANLKVPALIKA